MLVNVHPQEYSITFVLKIKFKIIRRNHLRCSKQKRTSLPFELQAIGSAFIPAHKFKENFLEYYEEYVKLNKRPVDLGSLANNL